MTAAAVSFGWILAVLFATFVAWDVLRRGLDQRRRERDGQRLDDERVTALAAHVQRLENRVRTVEGLPRSAGRPPYTPLADQFKSGNGM